MTAKPPIRLVLFGASIASLLLLTYAGVLIAFSVPMTDEMSAANPSVPAGARAVVVAIQEPTSVPTIAAGDDPALLLHGDDEGSFPTAAKDVRLGRALAYVPSGANGSIEVEGHTIDLAVISGGAEGWVAMGAAEAEPWFTNADETLGVVEKFETPTKLGALFGLGAVGFVAPLVFIIATHRGARRDRKAAASDAPASGSKAAATVGSSTSASACRECRAPLAPNAEFCMRCGAWTKGDPAHA